MIGNIGDTIVIESERVGSSGRRGVIEDVVQEQPRRYKVRWEDGHTSILANIRTTMTSLNVAPSTCQA